MQVDVASLLPPVLIGSTRYGIIFTEIFGTVSPIENKIVVFVEPDIALRTGSSNKNK